MILSAYIRDRKVLFPVDGIFIMSSQSIYAKAYVPDGLVLT
jgi:hypothetical protein